MTEPPSPFLLHPFDLLVWCVGPLGTAMRVRVLHAAKLYAYLHMRCQARQLDSYSTAQHCSTDRQLDRTRQTSTDLDTPAHAVSLDLPRAPRRDGLDSYSTATRQLLDSYSTATQQLLDRLDRQGLDSTSTAASTAARPSTEPRQLDSSTARAQEKHRVGLKLLKYIMKLYLIYDEQRAFAFA